MNDYMKLADGTKIPIEDGASLSEIHHVSDTEADASAVVAALTADNLQRVEFYNPEYDAPYGIYENLALTAEPEVKARNGGGYLVTLSLREPVEE